MKLQKRIIANILILSMMVGLMPSQAFAAGKGERGLDPDAIMSMMQDEVSVEKDEVKFSEMTSEEQTAYCKVADVDIEMMEYADSKGCSFQQAAKVVVDTNEMIANLTNFIPWANANGLKFETEPVIEPVVSVVETPVENQAPDVEKDPVDGIVQPPADGESTPVITDPVITLPVVVPEEDSAAPAPAPAPTETPAVTPVETPAETPADTSTEQVVQVIKGLPARVGAEIQESGWTSVEKADAVKKIQVAEGSKKVDLPERKPVENIITIPDQPSDKSPIDVLPVEDERPITIDPVPGSSEPGEKDEENETTEPVIVDEPEEVVTEPVIEKPATLRFTDEELVKIRTAIMDKLIALDYGKRPKRDSNGRVFADVEKYQQVYEAARVALVLGGDFQELMLESKNKAFIDSVPKGLTQEYRLNRDALSALKEESGSTWEEIDKVIEDYKGRRDKKSTEMGLSAISAMEFETAALVAGINKGSASRYMQDNYGYKSNGSESVGLNTGNLNWETGLVSIPGPGGMGLELGLTYNSSEANIESNSYTCTAEVFNLGENINAYKYINGIWTPVALNTLPELNLVQPTDPVVGSYADLVRIQKSWDSKTFYVKNYYDADVLVEYTSKISVAASPDAVTDVVESINPANVSNYVAAGWSFDLPIIKLDTAVEADPLKRVPTALNMGNGQEYGINFSILDQPDSGGTNGLIGYAKQDMKLTKTGTGTTTKYLLKYKDGTTYTFNVDGALTQIIDRYKNTLTYTYNYTTPTPIINGVTTPAFALSSIKDRAGKLITITYDGTGITVTPPNASEAIRLEKEPIGDGNWVLGEIRRPLSTTTKFLYAEKEAGFTFTKGDAYVEDKTYALMTQVTNPTGGNTVYHWEVGYGDLTDLGRFEYYRVTDRLDTDNSNEYNWTDYQYSGDRICYYFSKYRDAGPTYNTLVTDLGANDGSPGSSTVHYYNNLHLNGTSKVYNSAGAIAQETVPTYDHEMEKVKDSVTIYGGGSRTVEETWDINEYNDLLAHTSPTGVTTTWTYDAKFHMPTSETVARNEGDRVTQWTINGTTGDIDQMSVPFDTGSGVETRATVYTHDTYGNLLTETTPVGNGKTQKFTYAYSSGTYCTSKKITVTKPDATTQIITLGYTYDAPTGRVLSQTDGRYRTSYTYDALGRTTAIINPAVKVGTTSTITSKTVAYDDAQRLVTLVFEDGFTVRNQYDTLGNLVQRQNNNTGTFATTGTMEYDGFGRVSKITDANGKTTETLYDEFDRPVTIQYPESPTAVTIAYIDGLNKKQTTNEVGTVETQCFDNAGNLLIQQVGSSISEYQYDALNNCIYSRDPNGNVTEYAYNELGMLLEVANPKDEKTNYEYNLLGNQTVRTQQEYDASNTLSRNIVSTKDYDELGRIVKDTDPLGKSEIYTYDAAGNIISKTDRNGLPIAYEYDALNRITKVKENAVVKTSYNYNNLFTALRKISIGHEGRTTTRDFNANGSLKSETVGGKTTSYTYDANGNRASMKDPFGLNISYTYNARNWMTSMDAGGKIFTYGYYNNGMIKNLVYPNGTRSDYGYNGLDRLTSLSNTLTGVVGENTGSSSYSYQYDANGNITYANDNGNATSCSYDVLDRILTSSNAQGSLTYAYDARGNRTKLEGAIPDTIKSPARDALRNFTWNGRNQLTGFTSKTEEAAPTPTVSATYKYNQDGLRYQKSVSTNGAAAVTTGYYYDNTGKCIAETTATGAKAAQIVWGHKPLARIVGSTWYYYHYNGHGDVVSMSDSTGKAVNTYTYDIWGNVTKKVENGVVDNPILYSGEYYDKESGLYYLRARYYDPVVGRFISRDSYEGKITNPLSQNLYIYVGNNPLGYVDPSGHSRTKAEYAQAREWSKQNFNAREYVNVNITVVFVGVTGICMLVEAAAVYGPYAAASLGVTIQRARATVQGTQVSTLVKAAPVQIRPAPAPYVGGLEKFKGYTPKPGERTFGGYVKDNVSVQAEVKLFTKSQGFNTSLKNADGQFKRFGVDGHGPQLPDVHVHQPFRNIAPNGTIYGGQGKTPLVDVNLPNSKDIKQLYELLNNGKY